MADKSFGVKELNLLNASGTPTVTSPNNLNLNANTVAISTSATVGNNLTVTSTTNSANLNVTGIGTLTRAFVTDLSVSGVSTITVPANANPHSSWDVVNNSASAYRFTGPGQDGAEDNPDIYLVRGQRYVFKMNASGHPFQIRVSNGGSAYSDGVTNNGSQTGNVVFNVQHDAPAHLFYQCTSHGSMVGNIYIVGQHLANGANDRILTATSAYGMNAESNLQFDGTNLFMPNELRHLGDPDTKMGFDTDTIKFETAGSERLRIASSGQLGIAGANYGTSGQVLTSQGSGSAPTWATPAVLQYKYRGNNTQISRSSSGMADMGFGGVVITPKLSSSIMIVSFTGRGYASGSNQSYFSFFFNTNGGSYSQVPGLDSNNGMTRIINGDDFTVSMRYAHDHNTTSVLQYKIYASVGGGTTYLNWDSTYGLLTVEEIAS